MGNLYYGNTADPILIPDPVLAHLKVVAATKLRRGESFTVSWAHSPAGGAVGRTTLWLQPAIPLRFVFQTNEPEQLNPDLLKDMANEANSSAGLTIDLDARIPPVVASPAPTGRTPRPRFAA
ncbi:DUF7882 family protein [Microbacterium caowuchunii]|uniref:DUF7882 domain-containing protein n=1 Tax=Microbacterium caowuchunii TaxID=2614638 RepID=A0A5N0TAN1_9MICO|nr:hypothetical protein [Microbacterium caowuchunii]KAA9131738.1 hypothetical protein F6B40_12125 [Microbacterium caowuchunii]